jgi:hypothetical protein
MADLTITAANVAKGANAVIFNGTADASVTAGQTCYVDLTDASKLKLADNNASAATAVVKGIALHSTLANQPLALQTAGDITIGAMVAVGTIYCQSANAGAICPSGDLATGNYVSPLGIGVSSTVIRLAINNSGVAVP